MVINRGRGGGRREKRVKEGIKGDKIRLHLGC